jgi:hypothetical protein
VGCQESPKERFHDASPPPKSICPTGWNINVERYARTPPASALRQRIYGYD